MNNIDSIRNDIPVHKSIDGPWIGLLVLAIFIFVASIIAIPILYFCYRRYQQSTQSEDKSGILNNQSIGKRQIPIQIQEQPTKLYETQQINQFVPSPDNIQRVQQYYERTSNAYF